MNRFVRSLTLLLATAVAAPTLAAEDGEHGPAIGEAQLEPYYATGSLKKAYDALHSGRPAVALALLPSSGSDRPARWLRSEALHALGKDQAASRAYEEIAGQGGPLADRALHLAALRAIDAGDGTRAERLLGQVPTRYVEFDEAALERVRQVMKLRVPGPATAETVEEILAPIFAGKVRADRGLAHVLAGDAQRDAGAQDKAREHYRTAWLSHPLSGAAGSARQRDRQLGQGPAIPPEKLLRRAEILLEAHRNREALDQIAHIPLQPLCAGGCPGDRTPGGLLQAAISALAPDALPRQHEPTPEDVARSPDSPADPLSCRAKLNQGRALKKEHEYTKAKAALAPVVLRCADGDVRARALYLLAQIEGVFGKPAGPLWEALARKFPNSSLADDALFNQSIAERRAGDLPGERALLQELVERHLDADLRAEAMFRLFWSYQAEGKGRKGLPFLDQLAAHPDTDGADEERARYWRARVLLEDDPEESEAAKAAGREAARADLVWLAEERPLTYHGLLARGRLAEIDPDRTRAIDDAQDKEIRAALRPGGKPPLRAGTLGRDPHLLNAIELLRMGMRSEAVREIAAIDRSPVRSAGPTGHEALTLVADLYSRAGDHRSAHALVRTELRALLRRPAGPLSLRAAALAYPLAFRDRISEVAQRHAVPADLLQALLREESALDPRALSPTGALGLTQLMPATAREMARRLKLRGFEKGQLLDPDINIRIGGAYLGHLYSRFHHPALSLAAYNAGPGAVRGWVRARGSLPLDKFVEEIPLEETRGYVKRCLRSFAAYQFLYGDGRARATIVGQTLAAR